jgi:DNA topoisomerase-1
MKKALVIVESPAKARTIAKFLGSNYNVEASIGHIRDLPSTASEIPLKFKNETWARIGVDVDHEFKPLYIVPDEKKPQVKKLKALLKDASELFLATDEDREGEAIAWHLRDVLEPTVAVKRMVFHEITKKAIDEALTHTREIDQKLVDAQEARRILDRLYGYEVSPVLWRKVKSGLSAGRVQSVAVRLVVDRERGRMRFVKASYWDVDAALQTRADAKDRVGARLIELGGKRVASGKDFDPATGALTEARVTVLLSEAQAKQLAETLKSKPFTVSAVNERPFTQRPYPPFITSTLQQEAARKLRFAAKRTMRLAQDLYENGFITYMRTDSTNLSQQAIDAARSLVTEMYGKQFLPDEPRTYAKKVKGAQEAHEAVRPAGEVFRTPEQVRSELDEDQFRLYDLIWKRTVASQMKDATGQRTSVQLSADGETLGKATFVATGKVINFPGFLRAYVEGSDDPDAEIEDQEKVLPPLREGQALDALSLDAKGHETQPPARYTEASLIKELEDRGIGRPSTYASILQTIQDREYVKKKGTALYPTFIAFAVTNLLEKHFAELVDYDFTARMEEDLDSVAVGDRLAVPWLKDFYFGNEPETTSTALSAVGLKRRIGTGWEVIDPREISSIPLGLDEQGRPVAVRVGRYGPYLQVADSELRANVADDLPPDELTPDIIKAMLARSEQGDRVLGQHPETNQPIYAKNGRFGPYVQLGDMEPMEEGKKKKKKVTNKPKMASLFPTMKPETMTLGDALQLLSFPKTIGKHPVTGDEIIAQDGRYGPYLKMGTETRSLENHDKLMSVTVDDAVKAFEAPKQGRAMGQQRTLAEVGKHPKSEAVLKVMSGRFGAYVTDGVVNASLPKGQEAASLTVDQAVELIANREAKLKEMGKDPRAAKPKGARRASPAKAKAAAKVAVEKPAEETPAAVVKKPRIRKAASK